MLKFEPTKKQLIWSVTLISAAMMAACTSGSDSGGANTGTGTNTPGTTCSLASCVPLGAAANYAMFANTGIHTDAGASVITGNVGVGPGVTSSSITGFALTLPAASSYSTSTQVTGRVHAFDYAPPTPTEVTSASTAMGTAYTSAAGKVPAGGGLFTACPGTGNLGGLTISPGVYTCAIGVSIATATDVTLNGTATDVWVFKITGTFDQAAGTHVILTGGALPQNVFWQVSGAVNILANAHFEGIMLGQTAITMGNQSSINGRLLTQTAVTLDATTVKVP